VVDDGSEDDTHKKVVDYANSNNHVKVISHKKNLGKGEAVKTGFSYATGELVIFMDSDLDIEPSQIRNYVEALKHGDIVTASKWHPQSSVEEPLMRKFLSHGFNVLVKILTGTNIRDTQTGLKAFKRKALEKVFSKLAVKRYAFDAELLAVASLYGIKIIELPVNLRVQGVFNLRESFRMFIDLLGITYRLRVRKSYQ
jgi:glycosyltransferase involved in cell wall biosynthesis